MTATSRPSPKRSASSHARSSSDRLGGPRWQARLNTPSGTSWRAMSRTRSSREPPGPLDMSPRPGGSRRALPSGSRMSPTSSPTTTRRRSSSPERPGRRTRPPSSRLRHFDSCRSPERARSASIPARRSRTWSGPLPSRRSDMPNGPRRSCVSGRLPSTPDATPTRWKSLEEAIASFRARGDISATAKAILTCRRVLVPLGDPRQWTLPAEALALLEPLRTFTRTRMGPHRPRLHGSPPGQVRDGDRLRRTSGDPRRGAGSSPPCPGPRLAGVGPLQPRRCPRTGGLPRGDRTRHPSRAGTSGGHPPEQPRRAGLGLRRPRRIPGRPARRDRLREGPGAHRVARLAHAERDRCARRHRRARGGACDRRRPRAAPGGQRQCLRPGRDPCGAGQGRRSARRGPGSRGDARLARARRPGDR